MRGSQWRRGWRNRGVTPRTATRRGPVTSADPLATEDAALLRARCKELEEANAALTQSVAELEAFAGVVSHDLKNPLGTVAGYVQLLTYLDPQQRSSAEYQELLAGVTDGVQGMRRLIDDLLEFATAPGARLQLLRVDLDVLVREVVDAHLEMNRLGGGGPRPDITVEPLPSVHADRAMLRRVVDNLVDNAIKYTRPGQAARVHVSAAGHATGWVHVEVADRGIGIPDGRHEAVFAGFHRAHDGEGYPGNGLGLAFCRRIVQRHGGLIGARPNPGGGTRFWLTLPASEEAAAAPPRPVSAVPDHPEIWPPQPRVAPDPRDPGAHGLNLAS